MQCAPSDIDIETAVHRVRGHTGWQQGSHYCQHYGKLPLGTENDVAAIIVHGGEGAATTTGDTPMTVGGTILQWIRGVTEGEAAERETRSLCVTL